MEEGAELPKREKEGEGSAEELELEGEGEGEGWKVTREGMALSEEPGMEIGAVPLSGDDRREGEENMRAERCPEEEE